MIYLLDLSLVFPDRIVGRRLVEARRGRGERRLDEWASHASQRTGACGQWVIE